MNWDAVGAMGEVVGAAAVVLTLGYLALQMRQSARAQNVETYERMMSGYNQLNVARASVPGLAFLARKGMLYPEQLGDEETAQFDALVTGYVVNYLKIYKMYRQGAVEEGFFKSIATEAASIFFDSPGGPVFLERQPNWSVFLQMLCSYRFTEEEMANITAQPEKYF